MGLRAARSRLDDNAAIRKVYEALIRQHVAGQLRWNEGGNYVCEFQTQLRRSGEVMFMIPARSSGVERFDQEAQRAIGAASPLPVPGDNEAFAQIIFPTVRENQQTPIGQRRGSEVRDALAAPSRQRIRA